MRKSLGLTLTAAFLLVCGCAEEVNDMDDMPAVDTAAELAAATRVINQFEQIMVNEDLDLMDRVFARDPDLMVIGTDAAELWKGYDMFRSSVEQQFASYEDSEVVIRDQAVHLSRSGTVAWFSELMDWRLTAGGEAAQMSGMRFTGVLEKRDGVWVFVQAHVSLPVSGQAVAY